MKLSDFTAILAVAGQVMNTASTVAVIMGGIYLIDCRIAAKTEAAIDKCYFTAFPIMGIGVANKAGFSIGYNTLNPSLRKEDEQSAPGIFSGRKRG